MAHDLVQTLRADVEAACLLLSYAAQAGLDIKSDVSKIITQSKALLAGNNLVGESETAFYLAYREIAKLASPVTVVSLSAASEVAPQKWYQKLLHLEPTTESKRAVNWYWNLTFYWLFALIAVQFYWVIGSTTVTAIRESNDAETKVKLELSTLQAKLKSEKKPESNADTDKLDTEKTNLQNRKVTYFNILAGWNWAWQLKWKCLYQTLLEPEMMSKAGSQCELNAANNQTVLALASFVLLALQQYLLPLLYGLLGACTYVLRALLNDIRALSYTNKSFIGYKVHVVLGTLSGLAISWFFPPSAEIFKSLPPLALAFLAGYSVEILFAAMDKFVSAFSAKDQGQGKPTNP